MIANSQIATRKEFKKILGQYQDDLYSGEIKHQHLNSQLMCNPPTLSCWQGDCTQCEDSSNLRDQLEEIFKSLDIENITYKQWESTDRTELVTRIETVTEFVQNLIDQLQVLKAHQFINDQQTKYFYSVKENLTQGKALVVGDFSQNYGFVYQDAVQGVHWSNTSCTLHPWICYYRGQNNKIETFPLLFISDCLRHETAAVYAFQKELVKQLQQKLKGDGMTLTEIQYFSDGCSKQYKNKKIFLNLTYHQHDFGIPANWSFSATSHGKGPWDGIAGCAKRETALESLRNPIENQIQPATDFYTFVENKFKNIQVENISQEVIDKLETNILIDRFKTSKTITGTLGYHSFESIPENHNQVNVRKYSLSTTMKTVSVTKGRGRNVVMSK